MQRLDFTIHQHDTQGVRCGGCGGFRLRQECLRACQRQFAHDSHFHFQYITEIATGQCFGHDLKLVSAIQQHPCIQRVLVRSAVRHRQELTIHVEFRRAKRFAFSHFDRHRHDRAERLEYIG